MVLDLQLVSVYKTKDAMENKEFNLSERIRTYNPILNIEAPDVLEIQDVKQFIKELKENINEFWTNGEGQCICPECWEKIRHIPRPLGPQTSNIVCLKCDIEKEIISNTKEYLLFQKELGINPPIMFYLTLLGTKGFSIPHDRIDPFTTTHSIEREGLDFPKIIIGKFDIAPEEILKTSFNRIWNACGYPRSEYYDKNGKRTK